MKQLSISFIGKIEHEYVINKIARVTNIINRSTKSYLDFIIIDMNLIDIEIDDTNITLRSVEKPHLFVSIPIYKLYDITLNFKGF